MEEAPNMSIDTAQTIYDRVAKVGNQVTDLPRILTHPI